jgi:hypothetical protein
MRSMVRQALADGKLTGQEYRLLESTARKLGMVKYDTRTLVREERAQMFREAKVALRARRNGNL